MSSSLSSTTVTKPDQKRTPSTLLRSFLLLFAVTFLSACTVNAEDANDDDPTGVYSLIDVNGDKLPATASHGGVKIKVHSGIFVINANGTCNSKIVFNLPSGDDFTREVKATYTREGSKLSMQWKGAGKTVGNVEGDRFTMKNEGMVFAYQKQPKSPPLRIGTFDSRGVALAFYSSKEGTKLLEENGEPGLEARAHLQTFSTGSVTNII
jgi:hypothetical protein